MTANIDIAPTIAELTGAQPAEYVDGRSFVHLFGPTSQTDNWRKALLLETGYIDRDSRVISYRGLRTETFKYVEYESGDLEYYDLINDPYELDNLAAKLSPEVLTSLHEWLAELKVCEMDSCRNAENVIPEISK
jgi:arylsulfatase A-like enzyme